MHFSELHLHPALGRAVKAQGYVQPTRIQELAIPPIMRGRDVLGCAQTGTGKTAAFALPVLHRLLTESKSNKKGCVRVLVLAPTRELAIQIHDSFSSYGAFSRLRSLAIFGGVKQGAQTRALQRGTEILVATPGRLLDLIQQGFVDLSTVETFILDEADRMLDMGFIRDIRHITELLPQKRQVLLFSATMAPEIRSLADKLLHRPNEVSAAPIAATADDVEQSIVMVERPDKIATLVQLIQQETVERTLVFSRTKHGADKIVRHLTKASIPSSAIHGNKSQNNRQAALAAFKNGKVRVLVATDIASRGLDIEAVSHVINFDLPHEPEVYVHRVGRTGRAGARGVAVSFCSSEEREDLRSIQHLIKQHLPLWSRLEAEGSNIGQQLALPLPQANEAKRGPSKSPHKSFRRRSRRGRAVSAQSDFA